jgi:MFS family permease
MRVITRTPLLRGALLTALFSGLLCAPIITFCPVLVRNAFQGSAGQFSLAIGAFGVGGLLGALALLAVPAKRDRRVLGSAAAAAFGLTLVGAALAPWFWGLVVMLVMAGVTMSITNTSTNTLLQSAASPGLRGQAVSLYMLAMRGGGALGSLATGISVSLMGIRAALAINGALAIIVQLLIWRDWRRAAARSA